MIDIFGHDYRIPGLTTAYLPVVSLLITLKNRKIFTCARTKCVFLGNNSSLSYVFEDVGQVLTVQ